MSVFHLLLILFLSVPLIEIFLLLQVGSVIGPLPTVLLIIVTAVVGAALVRQQGLATFRRVQIQLQKAELPALELMEGVVVLIAGVLLVTPGFFTDALGFICLVPWARRHYLLKVINSYIAPRFIHHADDSTGDNRRTIDGEYWKDESDKQGNGRR